METEISTLPMEVITSIIVLLPIKDILRSKSVSKSWYNLISSPDFVKLHLNQHRSGSGSAPARALILNTKNSLQIIDFDSLNRIYNLDHPQSEKAAHLVGSCDGVICVCYRETHEFGLLNPATRTSRIVSGPRRLNPFAYFGDDACFGFGRDSCNDDFKTVLVCSSPVFLSVWVYSLKTDSWRVLWEEGSADKIMSRGVFVKGKMHWVSQWPGEKGLCRIRVFDIEHEYFRKSIMLPYCDEQIRYQREVRELAEFGGNLCFVTPVFDTGIGFCIHVWKEDSWTKLYTVPGLTPPLPVAACSRNGNRVLYREGGKLYWFNSIDDLKEDRVQVGGAEAFSGAVVSVGSLVAV